MSFLPKIPPMYPLGTPQRRNMLPVLGNGQWTEHAQQANWVLGHGSALVTSGPAGFPMADAEVHEFRFKCKPRPQNHYRLWCVSFSADDDGGGGMIRSLDSATDYARVDVPATLQDLPGHTTRVVTFVTDDTDDDVDGDGFSEFGFEILVDADVDAIYMVSCTCTEMPLAFAAPDEIAVDNVTFPDEASCESGQPIYDDELTPAQVGPAACAWAQVAAETNAKRSSMASWVSPVAAAGTSFAPIYGGSVPLLARRRYSSDGAGNREIRVWVYAFGLGQVKLTMTTGDTATLTYAAPLAYEWQTATISVDAEDLSTLDSEGGVRGGTLDQLLVETLHTIGEVFVVRCVCAGEID